MSNIKRASMDRETELTKKRYNRTSRFYDIMDWMISSELREKIIQQASGKVLEIGAGTGTNFAYYSQNCDLTAIDLSPGMLEKAREKAWVSMIPIKIMEMDAQKLKFPSNTFDTVVATCVFCSIPDPIKGLKEIKRVIKPSGKVILLEHVRSDNPVLGTMMDFLDPLVARMMGPHINRRTVDNVKEAGLAIKEIQNVDGKLLKYIVAEP